MILYLNELSKPTCVHNFLRKLWHRDLLGVSPLRPQKQKHGDPMTKTKIKKFRLTDLQLEQLEQHLKKENTNFTDFIQSLIQREVMQDAVTVKRPTEEELKPRTKIKTVIEVVKRYQKTDPNLLLELSKIGNNVNQIARALNVIKNVDPQEQRQLNISSIFSVLKGIQTELEQVFPSLPKISRQSPERLKKQLSSIQLAEEDESAY